VIGRSWRSVWAAIGVALLYAVVTQLVFRWAGEDGSLSVLSLGFLFLVPLASGVITLPLAPQARRNTAPYPNIAPWLSCIALAIITVVFSLDVAICVIMAMPLLFLLSSTGGIITWALVRKPAPEADALDPGLGRPGTFVLALAVLGPYLLGSLEQRAAAPDAVRTVSTRVEIAAPPEVVWRNVVRVPYIGEDEQRGSVFYTLGLPRPREATLSHEGSGGVRAARFDAGLTFLETVTTWRERDALAFTIEIDRTAPMPRPLAAVGGPYFDILDGEFRLRPLGGDRVLLELTSRHRVSTRFNAYAGLWTDWIMRDLQSSIVAVIEERAEAGR
jgi:hypothetical protein